MGAVLAFPFDKWQSQAEGEVRPLLEQHRRRTSSTVPNNGVYEVDRGGRGAFLRACVPTLFFDAVPNNRVTLTLAACLSFVQGAF
ncbi:hypothetical protein [Paenibacillus sp. KS-LC4]|uniref:hypothetical protein n=1 Tax=Paenibacillus sp. KS-LC4 TaxID=2979727 RepID=UPI0030D0A514